MNTETNREQWTPPNLSGRIAVVTGASRGVGRGVAEVLGECGATVYVSARSTRESPATGNPEQTIEAVAEDVERRGGVGIPVRCDHGSEAEIERLFRQVEAEQGRLDVLVNNVIGWDMEPSAPEVKDDLKRMIAPMWQRPVSNWDANFHVGLRSHFIACRFGIPIMLERRQGLIAFTGERPNAEPNPDLSIDVRAHATARFAFSLARRLEKRGIASLLLYPGFPRTEGIVQNWETGHPYFSGWTSEDFLAKTESTHYAGRAVAMLAADPDVMSKSGLTLGVYEVARSYGFTDVDGRQPVPLD
jgi:NAD(P)-dependent dehydrogenase (short-subunit alcohol dehydrogenase family)